MTTATIDEKTIKFTNVKVPQTNTKVKLVDETVKLRNEVDEAVGKLNLALRNSYKLFCDYNNATKSEQNLYQLWIRQVLREELKQNEDNFEPTEKTKDEAMLVQYIFNGLDRKTRSKYAKVLTDACNDKVEVKDFAVWYKNRGGLTANKVDKADVVNKLQHLLPRAEFTFENPFTSTADENKGTQQVWFVTYNEDGSKVAVAHCISGEKASKMFIEHFAYPSVKNSANTKVGSVEEAIAQSNKQVA